MNSFLLWMKSLDADKVAAEESFHSKNHRESLALHEMEKLRYASEKSRYQSFQSHLNEISQSWEAKNNKPKTQASHKTVRPKPVQTEFTDEQIQIAIKALTNKGKKL